VRPRAQAIEEASKRTIRPDSGLSIKPISVFGSERAHRYAFEYARRKGRKKVTTVHKANIMKHTDGLWLAVGREVAKQYPDIEFEDRIVDDMCMRLVQRPESYDVLVLPNLYGTSCPTCARASSAGSASPRAPTSATRWRSSRRPTGRRPGTRASTR